MLPMQNRHTIHNHLYISIALLLMATAVAFTLSLYLTQGHLTFAIHGPYIHWAMAKHLAQEGILSIDGYSYASVSSSPLWLFLIAPLYALLGESYFPLASLLLNLIPQIVTIIILFKIIQRFSDDKLHFIYALFLIAITPFLALTFGGLEHSLQIMLITLFLYNLFLLIQDKPNPSKVSTFPQRRMLLLAPLIVAVRYEDIALIIATAMVLTYYLHAWRFSIVLVFSSLILIALFGIWSEESFHLGFLPTSISAKSVGSAGHFDQFISNISYAHIIALLLLNGTLLYLSKKREDRLLQLNTTIYLITFLVHLAFAKVGWLYRYEAYLVFWGVLNLILALYRFQIAPKYRYLLLAILTIAGFKQIFFSPVKSILSTRAVYEQQIQEGLFAQKLHHYYIATDNIGTIPYFSNDKILDIHGLSNPRIINLKAVGEFNDKSKKALILSEGADLIIAYRVRFNDQKIPGYTKLATWKIKHNVLNGDDEVCFWARKGKEEEVRQTLQSFDALSLPTDVNVSWNQP